MKLFKFVIPVLGIFLLSSCFNDSGPASGEIEFKLGTKTPFNQNAGLNVELDSTDRTLRLVLQLKKARDISYPVDAETGDTLSFVSFTVEFLHKGKPLAVNKAALNMFSQRSMPFTLCDSAVLKLKTDTVSLLAQKEFVLSIPYLAFSSIPAGEERDLDIKWSQEYMYSGKKQRKVPNRYADSLIKLAGSTNMVDSVYVEERIAKKTKMIDFMLAFKINMPAVYNAEFICHRIELQNDDKWNPGGSDVTLFKSSYPDLYYELSYPVGFLQHQSYIQTSTGVWDIGDTCSLFYYDETDPLNFYLMDHDKLSRDDVITSNQLMLKNFSEASAKGGIHFGHISSLRGKLLPGKKVN